MREGLTVELARFTKGWSERAFTVVVRFTPRRSLTKQMTDFREELRGMEHRHQDKAREEPDH